MPSVTSSLYQNLSKNKMLSWPIMSKKRDCIRILSVQGDCDERNEKGAFDDGFHKMQVKTVHTPYEAITALRTQSFDCVVAMVPPADEGVKELAKKVKESFGLPFLFKASEDGSSRPEPCIVRRAETAHVQVEPFCTGSEGEFTLEAKSFSGEVSHLSVLPEYPRVSVDGRMITILWGKEREEVWGEEDSEGEAEEVATKMESELKAASYVTLRLLAFMGILNDELIDFGISQQQVENALWDGYERILSTFAELDNRA
jgi:hypothetical protein